MKKSFWLVSLCALLIIALSTGWSVPLRVAVVSNASVILLNIVQRATKIVGRKKEI